MDRVPSDRHPKITCRFPEKRPRRRSNAPGSGPRRGSSLAIGTVPRRSVVSELSQVLDSREVAALVADIEAARVFPQGRRGYGTRTMLGACLVRTLYALPTWTRTVRLIEEHAGLTEAIGGTPSEWACYRFMAKLREHSAALAAREVPTRGAPGHGRGRGYRRLRHGRVCERAALRQQGRQGARAVLRSGCELGASVGRLDAQGRRVLRVPAPPRHLHADGPAARVAGRDGAEPRVATSPRCSTRSAPGASGRRRARWTRGTTTTA
jgi:hypothetical protein